MVTNMNKILLVDDEKDIITLVSSRLKTAGYEVVTAVDGFEALAKAKSEKPDLIILDLMLPKMDGYQVCRLLKFDSTTAQIPIIMFTARAEGEKAGADAYLTKPFEPETLLAKIKELLERKRA